MPSSDYQKQVAEARSVHASIPETLKSSSIVLSKPKEKIFHSLQIRPQTEEEVQIQSGFQKFLDEHEHGFMARELEIASAARNYVNYQIPYVIKSAEQELLKLTLLRSWARYPDLKTLKEFVKSGFVPRDMFRDDGDPEPQHVTLKRAKEMGYQVPESFINSSTRKPRKDKENAYYAAKNLKDLQIHFAGESYRTREITSLCSGFLIPDPDEDWKVPFIADQLWVIQERNARLRFLALEIDSQFDLSDENKAKAKLRDDKFARQGLEVYHVAGWWCLVDPWRVISEFLREAEVYSEAKSMYGHIPFQSISDYKCKSCDELMIRFDDYWIERIRNDYSEELIVHNACIEDCYNY